MNAKKVHKSPVQFLREYGTDYLFAAPFFILFVLFTLVPIVASAVLSLTDFNAVSVHKFVGIQNYLNLILDDGLFLQALKNTFFLSVVTGPVGYFLCLLVAWLLNELGDRTRSLITLLFYAPVISGGAYTVWQIIYSGDAYGFLNGMLLELGIIDAPIQWLTDTSYMMPAAIVLILWMSFGTGFLSLIAGFKNVDKTLYEAGEVDGVRNRFQELWYPNTAILANLLENVSIRINNAYDVTGTLIARCAATLLIMLPLLVLFSFCQKYLVQSISTSGLSNG